MTKSFSLTHIEDGAFCDTFLGGYVKVGSEALRAAGLNIRPPKKCHRTPILYVCIYYIFFDQIIQLAIIDNPKFVQRACHLWELLFNTVVAC